MRQSLKLVATIAFVTVTAFMAWAAEQAPQGEVGPETGQMIEPVVRPIMGPGAMGPMRGCGPGWCSPAAGRGLHESPLDSLASVPYRPAWAPLPMFRGDLKPVPALHALLDSEDADNRARAAFVLGQIACPSSLGPLAKRLKDKARAVRVQAGIALACMGDQRGIPTCAAVIRNDPPWVRYYAAYGLWCIPSARTTAILQHSLPGQGDLVTTAIQGALSTPYVRPPEVNPLVEEAPPGAQPSAQEVWEQAADVMTQESDWWWHKGDYEQAIRCHEASLLLDPTYVEAYAVIAWLQWSLGRDTEALATLRRGTVAAPHDPTAFFNLGFHLFNTGRYQRAEPVLRRAVELGGTDLLIRRAYAHCLEKLGRLSDALAQWEAVVQELPTDGAALYNRDRLRELVGLTAAH